MADSVGPGLCAGGHLCGGEVRSGVVGVGSGVTVARSEAVVQLRRDVAAKLIKLARDIRLGERESVAGQLEVTAALLDPRYTPLVTEAPLPQQGYIPPALPSLSSILNPNAARRDESEGDGVGRGGGGGKGATEGGDGSGGGRDENEGDQSKDQNQGSHVGTGANQGEIGTGILQGSPAKYHPESSPSHQSETRTNNRLGTGQLNHHQSEDWSNHPSGAMVGDLPTDNYYLQSFKSVYPVYPDRSSPDFFDGPTDKFPNHLVHPPEDPSHSSTHLPNHVPPSNHQSPSRPQDYPPNYRYPSKLNYQPNQNYPYNPNPQNYPPKHHPPPSPHLDHEDILHKRPDHSYQKLPKPPSITDVRELVTVIIDGCSTSPGLTSGVARQARGVWDGVRVVVGIDEERRAEVEDVSHLPQLSIITMECDRWRHDLRPLMANVLTLYVLVLSGVSAITPDLDLSRLLAVIEARQRVGAVGGAERGKDGTWESPCVQLQMHNSLLKLRDGYEFSQDACLYCDVTSASFLASTQVMLDLPFDLTLPSKPQMVDWGLRLQRRGILTMTCPDVMFHVSRNVKQPQHRDQDQHCQTKEERRAARSEAWTARKPFRKLAQKWEVTHLAFDNGTIYEFTCRDIRFNCRAYERVRHYMLPPCCIKFKNKMLTTIDIIARENRLPYEINAGTLLGAVKFQDGLPWDFDDDASFRNQDVEVYMRNKQRMKRLGLFPNFIDQPHRDKKAVVGKYVHASTQGGFSLDFWGRPSLKSLATTHMMNTLPDNLACFQSGHVLTTVSMAKKIILNVTQSNTSPKKNSKKSTSIPEFYLQSHVRIGSNWLPAPWNPGKAALLKYGAALYKHETHWRWLNQSQAGWKVCPRPGHHTCLDLHPLDGSLPFN
ncbi:hypothetical protein Pmani_009615 [Petrolisthes manimaculis]|uniref:Uncharacterized protein n=1 Tax=Petrolisthes manimaculis TaxID=1843537 RepID=A0AAE1Q4L0_9EUCA|nr:hypothetical protein Pmani_009615 [Petrolisthes manimaculis]